MATTSPILGQYEANLNKQAGTDRVATDKDTFLKLLVAQLTHQDPLNPVEDKEFIAQLAQFTSVEELQNINKGIEGLNGAYLQQQMTGVASFVGSYVEAKGDQVRIANIGSEDETKKPSSTPISITYPKEAHKVTYNVYATNADGTIGKLVYSEAQGSKAAGSETWQWPGMDSNKNKMPDGAYIVNVTAEDKDGEKMLVNTMTSGQVLAVETAADGNHKLFLDGGRSVYFKDVSVITDPTYMQGGKTEKDKEETPTT